MNEKLTAKREAFLLEYLIDHNATQAAIRAGYSPHSAGSYGRDLLRMPAIQEALARMKAERVRRTQIDQDYVLEQLVANVQRSMQAEPVLDRKGQPTGVYRYEGHVANEALKLLAKHTGGFEGDQRKEKNVTIIVDTGVPGPPGCHGHLLEPLRGGTACGG